jgi:hypothetical protein
MDKRQKTPEWEFSIIRVCHAIVGGDKGGHVRRTRCLVSRIRLGCHHCSYFPAQELSGNLFAVVRRRCDASPYLDAQRSDDSAPEGAAECQCCHATGTSRFPRHCSSSMSSTEA